MIRRDDVNDVQLYNHLEAMLKQNKGSFSLRNFHYGLGDQGFIFRREKSQRLRSVLLWLANFCSIF